MLLDGLPDELPEVLVTGTGPRAGAAVPSAGVVARVPPDARVEVEDPPHDADAPTPMATANSIPATRKGTASSRRRLHAATRREPAIRTLALSAHNGSY